MTKPRLLLFDLGNVLVRFEPEKFSLALGFNATKGQIHYESGVRELTNRYESGKTTTDEYFNALRDFLKNQFEIPLLESAFLSVLTDPIPGMEELVRNATKRLPSALVSNTNELHFSSVLTRVPALKYLPKRYLSYRIGAIKPSAEFYEHIIKDEDVKPGEMLFIDDVAANVAAAEKAGMVGFLFNSAERLEDYLKHVGVFSLSVSPRSSQFHN